MQNFNPTLSVIIVNYRSGQYLERCLASLYSKASLPENTEIIIVNNDSRDSLGKIKLNFPQTKIINHQKNIGFGSANNKGAREASGKYLLLLNPDTEILENNLTNILGRLEENAEIAVAGPRLMTEQGETQWWCAGKEFGLRQLIKNNLGMIESKKIWESQDEVFADWVSGTSMFVKKEIFDKVGGFDEGFFMYFEDDDLCRRIRMAGYKILYYPEATVLHKGGKSRESLFRQKMQYFKSMAHHAKKRIKAL